MVSDAAKVCPVLVGSALPAAQVKTAEGKPVELREALGGKPAVLLFYRGGWCPYCNTHLGEIAAIEDQLRALGVAVFALSADRPGKLAETRADKKLGYTLLSDAEMNAAHALGIAFRVDDATVSKYKNSYGIDLEADSGQTHHQLPVPSAFVVDGAGTIAFAYVNPDYKVRVKGEVLLAAAKAVGRGG